MANGVSSAFGLDYVLHLLDQIKTTFVKYPQKFEAFKGILTNYLKNEIEVSEVLWRFRCLFTDHSELTAGFDRLLPPKLKLEDDRQLFFMKKEINNGSDESTRNHAVDVSCPDERDVKIENCAVSVEGFVEDDVFRSCFDFFKRVQSKYKDQPEIVQKFCDTLQEFLSKFQQRSKDLSMLDNHDEHTRNAVQEFSLLFAEDQELFRELKRIVFGSFKESADKNKPDPSALDVIKYGTYEEFSFFDEVRHQMENEETFLNFMRCLQLFACDLISGSELLSVIEPFYVRSPDLMRQMKKMIKCDATEFESVSQAALNLRKNQHPDVAMEIDYSSCRKQGVSYRALPVSFPQPICSARTDLCNEVLNDTWVSFPLWSEDTTFGNSKITAYQEFLYRCEDERFELQIVIDSVSSTIEIFEGLCEKMDGMTPEQQSKLKLDDCLGGTSEVLQKKSIQRIYGDKAGQIINGLKENPCIAVPIALRRLKAKAQEWKEHQERFNVLWTDLNVKNYQKSLYNDTSTFKQNDQKDTKTKNLLQEAEAIFYENQAQSSQNIRKIRGQQFVFSDKRILYDASVLMNHFLSHLPTVQNDEGFVISRLLTEFVPGLIYIPGSEFSDGLVRKNTQGESGMVERDEGKEEVYTVMYSTSDWYLFIRLYHKLYERLLDIRQRCQQMAKLGLIRADLVTPQGFKASNPYEYVLLMTECLVEGNLENSAYEDLLRSVFETSASSMFALDRLLQNIMKQLQHITSDDLNKELMMLFESEKRKGGAGGRLSSFRSRSVQEMSYWRKTYETLPDDCYRVVFYKYKGLVTVELMYLERPERDCFEEMKQWTEYIDNYVTSDNVETSLVQKPLFLKRNLQNDRHDAVISFLEGKESPMTAIDNMQCQFSINSLKITFTSDSWDFFRFHSLTRSSSRSQNKVRAIRLSKFHKWQNLWKQRNVTNEQERRFREWTTGHKGIRAKSRQQYERGFMPHRQCKKSGREKRS